MTMHIEITIAGTAVHHVAVVNEGPASDGVHHRYRWVSNRGPHGHLLHDRSEGAVALAVQVLGRLERHQAATTDAA